MASVATGERRLTVPLVGSSSACMSLPPRPPIVLEGIDHLLLLVSGMSQDMAAPCGEIRQARMA